MTPIINRFKTSKLFIAALVFLLTFTTSCSNSETSTISSNQSSKVKTSIPEIPALGHSLNVHTIERIVDTLSSDEFEGRKTFSNGNEKAGKYIASIYADIGLDSLSGNSYFLEYEQNGVSGNYISNETVQNIVGLIKGTDSDKAIIISAHFDSLGSKDGEIYRGAYDNASGVAALIKIAEKLKRISVENSFESNIIFCAFNGEEQLYAGSAAFVKQSLSKSGYKNMYNINIDSIGAENGGEYVFPNDSKYSQKLYDSIKSFMNKNRIVLIETTEIIGSDHRSFEQMSIPNITISQENFRDWVNKPVDTPDILDYEEIEKIANVLSDFIIHNDGIVY
ncbi:arginine utilization protein RocB [Sporosarcina luteola]|nr:arginine utilization protein RocB [Sporosarcina luteola]